MFHKTIAVIAFVCFQKGNSLSIGAPKCLSQSELLSLAYPLPMSQPVPFETVTDCGPASLPLPIIQAPPLTVPTVEGPIISLPSPPIPSPKTIGHQCICTKTVVKPQLIQRSITVPTVQRYLKRTFSPAIENITYKAKPKCTSSSASGTSVSAPVFVPPPFPRLAVPFSNIC